MIILVYLYSSTPIPFSKGHKHPGEKVLGSKYGPWLKFQTQNVTFKLQNMTDTHRWTGSILVNQMIYAATAHVEKLPIKHDSQNIWTGIATTAEGSRRLSWKSEADEDVVSGYR